MILYLLCRLYGWLWGTGMPTYGVDLVAMFSVLMDAVSIIGAAILYHENRKARR